ncbi:MAG: hypothetical protein ACMUIE_05475 [Thermoplasmatota archaeon]
MLRKFGVREFVALGAFLFLVAVAVLVAVFHKGSEEMVNPNITLRVDDTWITNSTAENLTPVNGKLWQVVHVNISNLNEESEFIVSIPHFYGYTDKGERIWVYNGEDFDYPSIEPGQNITVILLFQITEDDLLSEIEYTQRVSEPVKCEVPETDIPPELRLTSR